MNPARLIERKRDGGELDPAELSGFFAAYLDGAVEEYQMSAFLMAVLFRGLTPGELDTLVDFMLRSGEVLDFSDLGGPRVDKHSTGGVGDKVSLPLAPLVAEAGVFVPMMSGRGLGHSGGTLDKLESIPGFRTGLSLAEFRAGLVENRVAMIGQTDEIAPLDRRLYDLRSVTGTVNSIPLIAASIMSKKLAEGLTGLVLDVKCGRGAFLREEEDAIELARTMVGIGATRGVPTTALVTAMDRPLGRTAGNALEVREAIECLMGGGPSDLREVTLALAAEMLVLGGIDPDLAPAHERASKLLDSGAPIERFRRMIERQGGDPAVVDDPDRLPRAPIEREVQAGSTGVVQAVDPLALGFGVVELGGGRTRLGEAIHPGVGFSWDVSPGDEVRAGERIGVVHARNEGEADRGEAILTQAIQIAPDGTSTREDGSSKVRPLLSHRITDERVARIRI